MKNMTNHQESEPVAEFEVGKGILFSADIDDLVGTDNNPYGVPNRNSKPDEDTSHIEKESEEDGRPEFEDPEEEDDPIEAPLPGEEGYQEEITGEDEYSDYSESALYALALESKVPGLFGEVDKNLSPEQFIESLNSKVVEAMDSAREAALNSVGQGKEYIDLLLNSPDPEATQDVIKQAHSYEMFAGLDIEDAEEKDLENIVKAMYTLKDIPKEDIDELIETHKDTGKLKSKAREAKNFYSQLKDNVIEEEKRQQKYYRQQHEESIAAQRNEIDKIISSGSILGIPLPKEKQDKFKSWMYNPTEVVEYVDPSTKQKSVHRLTKSQVAMNEFNKSPEKQLAFYLMVMDNFKFTEIEEKVKESRDKEILKHLENRSKSPKEKTSGKRNPYLQYSEY